MNELNFPVFKNQNERNNTIIVEHAHKSLHTQKKKKEQNNVEWSGANKKSFNKINKRIYPHTYALTSI